MVKVSHCHHIHCKSDKKMWAHHGHVDVRCVELHVDLFVDQCLAALGVILENV